ncbi:MAG TPA: MogA/MoaB family molybdenum cofactor biosynthesis protein [Dehalococcoidia bacterium]|nr:MogA/MoaB family molybdenum cofactor biosynthesis protein [Dehalococcoidia bacterium]
MVTVSDRCAAGLAQDESGVVIAQRLEQLPASVVVRRVVPDEPDGIRDAFRAATAAADIAVFTGGTGLAQRDVTPQTLLPLLDYEVPGMAEAMRAAGLRQTALALLSRQIAGVAGRCLVLALPGSVRAVSESLDAVWPALPHALSLLRGDAHH